MTKYRARFSARKHGAIGTFDNVVVEFEGLPGLDRSSGFSLARETLEAAGFECHHLIELSEVKP